MIVLFMSSGGDGGGASSERGEGGSGGGDPDEIIRKLINDPRRSTSAEEIDLILQHIANAPFNTRRVRVDPQIVGGRVPGQTTPAT